MQGLDHLLELAHLLARGPRGRVLVVRSEEADRVVAPVVAEALVSERRVLHELVRRQELDGGDPEVGEVLDRCRVRESGVGAADLLGDVGVLLREALDVHLVHDGVGVGGPRAGVAVPVEVAVGDDGLRHRARRVGVVPLLRVLHVVAEERLPPLVRPVDRGRVGVEQELRRVVPQPVRRVPGAVDPEAVAGADGDVRHDVVEGVAGAVPELGAVFGAVLVEAAELDALGGAREEGDVRAAVDERHAERGAGGSGHVVLVPVGCCVLGRTSYPGRVGAATTDPEGRRGARPPHASRPPSGGVRPRCVRRRRAAPRRARTRPHRSRGTRSPRRPPVRSRAGRRVRPPRAGRAPHPSRRCPRCGSGRG